MKKGSGLVHGASQTGGSLYVEPVALLELNNALETRLADETEEVARILAALGPRATPRAATCGRGCDRAHARLRSDFAARPHISATGRLRLVRARHPLLNLALERAGTLDRQVPLDFYSKPGGGCWSSPVPTPAARPWRSKQVGSDRPSACCRFRAHGSELPVFEQVFADIGDEQSLESSL